MKEKPIDTDQWVLLYDGGCGFCKKWIRKWEAFSGASVRYEAYQDAAEKLGVPLEDCRKSVQLLSPDGRRYSGAEAVFRSLAAGGRYGWLLWSYKNVAGTAPFAEFLYRFVAARRALFSRFVPKDPSHRARGEYRTSAWLFLRGLGIVHFIAFLSLLLQWEGLIGSAGILPAGAFLEALSLRLGEERFYFLPTLAWIDSSDFFFQTLCITGLFASVFLLFGILAFPSLAVLWTCYLSFFSAAREFLGYQWDTLLLEITFISLLIPPIFQIRQRRGSITLSGPVFLLLKWLLFRLMFSSGVVKLSSGDPVWRNLTALQYHYETQPLPQWTSFYFHHFPDWFHIASCLIMFGIELIVPFFIFGPRNFRLFAGVSFILFQFLILLTGNYGFFNLLSALLCLLLFDDEFWRGLFRKPRIVNAAQECSPSRSFPKWLALPLAIYLFLISLVPFSHAFRLPFTLPEILARSHQFLSPFHIVNGYGLFAVMTQTRDEIIVQGSNDGIEWLDYDFYYKPQKLDRFSKWAAPYQPRLDWQMWFAALSSVENQPWFVSFCHKLLIGSPPVLKLLRTNPFPESPPLFVRAVIYRYRFADPETRFSSGKVWARENVRLYMPPISLKEKAAAVRSS